MKRILTMLLALAMVVSVVACGKKSNDSANDKPVDVLTKVWATYKDNEKFAAGGGDAEHTVMDGPGQYDISDVEGLDAQLGFPQASVALIDDAASLVHMMNANTFTAGAYYVSDVNEVEMLVEDMKDNIMSRQWICGYGLPASFTGYLPVLAVLCQNGCYHPLGTMECDHTGWAGSGPLHESLCLRCGWRLFVPQGFGTGAS